MKEPRFGKVYDKLSPIMIAQPNLPHGRLSLIIDHEADLTGLGLVVFLKVQEISESRDSEFESLLKVQHNCF